ncbi:MAG: DUF262 domain-containing protein, partial [Actinomycetes bacterium]
MDAQNAPAGPVVPQYKTVKQLLSGSFSIDDYQREYKWDHKNIEELVTDLATRFQLFYREGDDPAKTAGYGDYFLGSIIVARRSGKNFLVDGQQRVTSLSLLLIYLYREALHRDLGVRDQLKPLIYSDQRGLKKFNLDVPERTPVFVALFNGEDFNADGREESVQNLVGRYQDIVEMDLAGELKEGFEAFVYWLIENVGLIEILAPTDEAAYLIFETMNDRGKPLSPVDMLKASLLAPVSTEDQRLAANRVWKQTVFKLISWGGETDTERDSAFMKAWLRAQFADSTRVRSAGATDKDWELIGGSFHRWLRDNAGRVGVGSGAQNLKFITEELPFFARAYRTILDGSSAYIPGLEPVFYNAHNDFTWQPTVLL